MSHLRREDVKFLAMAVQTQQPWKYEGPIAPIIASILGLVLWAVFILLYALLMSNSYSVYQNIIVTIVSLVIALLLIGLMWIFFIPKRAWRAGG